MYPAVIIIEIFILPLLLSNYKDTEYCFFIILGFSVLISMYILISTPYIERSNNIRLVIHRVMFTLIIINLIIIKKYINSETELDSPFFNLAWIFVVLLIINWIMNFSWIIWKTIKSYRKPGLIDVKLVIDLKEKTKKP